MRGGDYDTAVASYRAALERVPGDDLLESALVSAYVARARRRRASGVSGLEGAEGDLRLALALRPDDASLRRSLAVVVLDRASREADPARAKAMRAEALALEPELGASLLDVSLVVERRLDLAYELVERGQVDAGIEELERLERDRPDHPEVTRLLAQAYVHRAGTRAQRSRFAEAGADLDRAVERYARIAPCDGVRCDAEELRRSHHNRVVAWIEAEDAARARAALSDARAAGLSFPALAAAVRDLERVVP
jgi:tetratricopeptide (TPR) repeat protein